MVKSHTMIYKTLVIGVIILLVGVGIQHALAVTPKTSDKDDECNLCPKVSKQHIVRVKSFLKNLKKHDRIKSVLPKYNPKVTDKYQQLSDKIIIFKEMNKRINPDNEYPIICSVLFTIIFTILLPYEFISLPIYNYLFNFREKHPILFFISILLLVPYVIVLPFFLFIFLFNCNIYY